MIKTTTNYYDLNHTMLERKTIMVIKTYLPQRYEICHLHSHQAIQSRTTKLYLPQKINELADTFVKKFAMTPLNINIPFAPISVYFYNTYIPNNYQH